MGDYAGFCGFLGVYEILMFFRTLARMAPFNKATFGGGCFWGMEKYFKDEFKDALKTIQGNGTLLARNYNAHALCSWILRRKDKKPYV